MTQRALIIDDSSTVRSIIAKMLHSWGISSTQAENGQEAYTRLEKEANFTIAFVDWNMPVMDGLEFVRSVRAEQRYEALKLVMVTTETEMPRLCAALEAGADEYLMKPFTKEAFREKLALLGVPGLPD